MLILFKMDRSRLLKEKADYIRKEVVRVAVKNKAGHIASSLSCVDILVALYYNCISYRAKDPFWEGRDRLIFSKGHGCYALYAILADKGIIPKKEWEMFYTKESSLSGCIERSLEYGLESSCGSLGHGLPIAVGIAFGAKIQQRNYYTYCIVGDGEFQEGTAWEVLQFAVKHELSNLIIIIDHNRLQAMDFIVNIMDKEEKDIIKKLQGFRLSPVGCPGHDVIKLSNSIQDCKLARGNQPKVIVAETVKGFGLKCMENVPKFHFRLPTDEEMAMERKSE